MAEILFPGPLRALDANGDPVASAQARFYRSDTDTLETVYADEAGTTAHPDPLVADANGIFPPVFNTSSFQIKTDVLDPSTGLSLPGYPNNKSLAAGTSVGAASAISFSPTANIAQTDVQAAIEQVDNNWRGAKSGSDDDIISGTAGTNGNLSSWNTDGDLVDAGYNVLDEDDLVSDSPTAVPTQQSAKAYVDNAVTGLQTAFYFLATADASNDAVIDFTAFDGAAYDGYVFVLSNIIPATDNVDFYMRLSNDGGATFRSGASDYRQTAYFQGSDGASQSLNDQANAAQISFVGNLNVGSAAAESGISATIYVYGPHLAGVRTRVSGEMIYTSFTNILIGGFARAEVTTAEANDAVRFLFSSGNIESGTITMYGLRNT